MKSFPAQPLFLPSVDVSARRRHSVRENVSAALKVSRLPSDDWNALLPTITESIVPKNRRCQNKTAIK